MAFVDDNEDIHSFALTGTDRNYLSLSEVGFK